MCHVCGSSETFIGAWNMKYCFTLSQVIFLRKFLLAVNGTASGDNSTKETATKSDTQNTGDATFQAFGFEAQGSGLVWAMGLLVTELVSVLLIAWSWSSLYRLACS